jgi:hypothetical protein
MDMIQAIGAPFPVEYSSCSNKLPQHFRWTDQDRPIKVYIDRGIALGLQEPKREGEKKIAWVCESRAIFHLSFPRELFENQLERISQSFDYVFVSDRSMCKYSNIFYNPAGSNLPWLSIYRDLPMKTKNTSLVASPKKITFGHAIRHIIAEKFKDVIDVYGGAAGTTRFGYGENIWPDKSNATVPYRFSIVIENDSYSTYYTEKITDCFASGTIPVYWGAPDIGEHFNEDGIIKLTSEFNPSILTPELYESKLEAVKDNLERVRNLKSADDILYFNIASK